MFFLVVRAYLLLIRFELCLVRGDFAALYAAVRQRRCRNGIRDAQSIALVSSAIDMACIWYWKHVLCLQRSAATACLLKDHGVPAQLVIGAQLMPFQAHAWVEVEGRVVNDSEYTKEMYAVLDRC